MTIARRLQLLIFIALTSIVTLSVYALAELKETGDRGQFIVDNTLPSYETLYGIDGEARTLNTLILRHMLYTDPAEKTVTERGIAETRKALDVDVAKYDKDLVGNPEDRKAFDQVKAALQGYLGILDKNLDLVNAGQLDQARELLKTAPIRAVRAAVEGDIAINRKVGEDFSRTSKSLYNQEIFVLSAGGILATLLSIFLGYTTYRSTVGSLAALRNAVSGITRSLDFTLRSPVLRRDEAGLTATAFNELIAKIQESFGSIQRKTGEVNGAATGLASAATQVSSSSSYQSDSASHMAASVEQMTVSISHVASRASETNELVEAAGRAAQSGEGIIQSTVEEIHAIETAIARASEDIAELEKKSVQITAVVTVIREVANQTNLLALNAAIEAARAGEEGRGFAVVADEVRKLAERTSTSTQEISESIALMQSSAQNSVSAIATVAEHVKKGVGHAQAASDAIALIGRSTRDSVKAVAEINDTIREQTNAMTSIAQQVEKIAQMTEENSAAANTTAGTAKDLDGIAGEMQAVVAQFKIA